MVTTLHDRARGCLGGLAVGDALGSPSEGKTPAAIRERWGRITGFLSADQGGTDDTEYALFSARLLFEHGFDLTAADIVAAYRRDIISAENAYKGAGFSEILSIRNLEAGLLPPASGRHLHAWSDGLAMRVAPYGIAAAGDPMLAAHLAGIDGSVSHAGEGILSGQAVAAGIAAAMDGAGVAAIVMAALGVIPEDSWTFRAIRRGVAIGDETADVWAALDPLHDALVCHPYFWPDLAPEAVGLAFGLVAAARSDFREAVLGGVNIGRDTDTIAAIAGTLCGARGGEAVIPAEWRSRVDAARRTCIRTVRGMDIRDSAGRLADLAQSRRTP